MWRLKRGFLPTKTGVWSGCGFQCSIRRVLRTRENDVGKWGQTYHPCDVWGIYRVTLLYICGLVFCNHYVTTHRLIAHLYSPLQPHSPNPRRQLPRRWCEEVILPLVIYSSRTFDHIDLTLGHYEETKWEHKTDGKYVRFLVYKKRQFLMARNHWFWEFYSYRSSFPIELYSTSQNKNQWEKSIFSLSKKL